MRILQLTDFYPPAMGGMERHVESLSQAFAADGHDVVVAAPGQAGAPAFAVEGRVRVHRLPAWTSALSRFSEDPGHTFHPPAPDPGLMTRLRRLLVTEGIDVVHTHGWSTYSYLALRARDRTLPPAVATMHDYGHVCTRRTMQRSDGPCERASLRRCGSCGTAQYGRARSEVLSLALHASNRLVGAADRWIAVSNSVAAVARDELGVDSVVVPSFVPDVVAAEIAAATARPACVPATGDYLVFVGALSRHKGLETLLEAHAAVPGAPPLVCVGADRADGPGSWPGNVIRTGSLGHAEVMAVTRHATAAIVPSLWREPFGQTAVEALLAGTPLIAARSGALPDIVTHEQTGLLVEPGDVAGLASALTRLLSDAALRERLAAAGPVRGREFLVSAVAPRVEAVLRSVVDAPLEVAV